MPRRPPRAAPPRGGERRGAELPAVQKGGNANEPGNVCARPGGRPLLSLTASSPGIGLAGEGAGMAGRARRHCFRVRCSREDP